MKKLVMLFLLGSCLISAGAVQWSRDDLETPKTKSAKIQLALLLDTSNSMDGLIDQAKAKLWEIVNDMADYQLKGQALDIEIALFDYGNSTNSIFNHYIHLYSDFTSDVDEISEKLFSLTTKGGDEFCGAVIQQSIDDLEWREDAAYKVMFIAGNESFSQGSISFQSAITNAKEHDVIVNTIFCGGLQQGIKQQWKEAANLGQGEYFVIDQNESISYIETPQDKKIAALNRRLNETYIPYGSEGTNKYNKLKNQDKNASIYGASNMASRTIYKSKKQYNNSSWDLVDAYELSNAVIEKTDKLPEQFKQLSLQEREKEIIKMKKIRSQIKNEINKLSQERQSHMQVIKNKTKTDDLGDSMTKSLQRQMNNKGIHKASTSDQSAKINYDSFSELTEEVNAYRASRLITVEQFNDMSADEHTIILDTRSKWAFNGRHIKGAVHLNFSDFTADKLAEIIPDKNTRILIYCNNNFFGDPARMALKSMPLALNIPTFINLFGYGYKNVYELKSYVSVDDQRMQFEGEVINSPPTITQHK